MISSKPALESKANYTAPGVLPMADPLYVAKSGDQFLALLPAHGQPPRPDHRRHRHRQDRHPAVAGRALFVHRRAGVHGRREGRSVRHRRGRDCVAQAAAAPRSAGPRPTSCLTPARWCSGTCSARQRPPGARHRLRHGTAAAGAPAQPQRHPGRRAATWCSRSPTTTACCCSTSRTCAPWCSTSATTPSSSPPNTATSRPPPSAPSSAAC